MRNEYKVTYEMPPISEIVKEQFIKAHNIQNAVSFFFSDKECTTVVFKVELIDTDVE